MISRTHNMSLKCKPAQPLLYNGYMNKLLTLALSLPLVACVVGTDDPGTTGDPGGGDPGGGDPGGGDPGGGGTTPDPQNLKGTISDNFTLSGAVKLTGALTIDTGATVTVMPGTTIEVTTNTASINVKGTLDVQGAKGNIVTLQPTNPADHWGGVTVSGTYNLTYGKQVGGPIHTSTGSTTKIVDSEMNRAQGDFIVTSGGALDVQYSNLGLESGDTTHCNLHLGAASPLVFTHNNNAGAPYGLMFYAGGGDFTHNNWITSSGQYAVEPGNSGTADFSGSYFSGGQPTGTTGLKYNNLAGARLTDVGPR